MKTIRLENPDTVAEIALLGAELRHWRVGATDLIWQPDSAIWPDTAPILFPVVGWTRGGQVKVAGETYPLGLHGFARGMPFSVVDCGKHAATLRLSSSAATRRLYPFDFTLDVTYRLEGRALVTELTVGNRGEGAMPYACGLHPGFRWPFAGGALDDYRISFAEPELARVPVISRDGLFTHETRPVPLEGRHLALSAEVFAAEALCFLDAMSRSLRFAHVGGACLTLEFEGFPHIALWSKPAGRFLSIEAWTGRGDDVDSDGDLMCKPSMIHLGEGATRSHRARFDYSP